MSIARRQLSSARSLRCCSGARKASNASAGSPPEVSRKYASKPRSALMRVCAREPNSSRMIAKSAGSAARSIAVVSRSAVAQSLPGMSATGTAATVGGVPALQLQLQPQRLLRGRGPHHNPHPLGLAPCPALGRHQRRLLRR
eukprot:3618638-Prymnesium_polylepis.1